MNISLLPLPTTGRLTAGASEDSEAKLGVIATACYSDRSEDIINAERRLNVPKRSSVVKLSPCSL